MTSNLQDFPWVTAVERLYGPLADAFGMRPALDAVQAWCELGEAQLGEVVANAQVGGVVAAAGLDGINRFAQRLDRLRREGKAVESPTALLRTGLSELDGAMHAAMLSEPGLAATAASVRAASRRRRVCQQLSELGAEAVGQPTRSELDEAYRDIQQLKREVRGLKRAARAVSEGKQP